MPDENVNKWKQEGRLYLWRYIENTQNYPGWHLTADDTCCHSLADLIERMLAARWSSQKSLVVTPPTKEVLSVPNNRGGAAIWKAVGILILRYPKDKVGDEHFSLKENGDEIILSAGRENLKLLKKWILGIPKGEGDYAIEIGQTRLWFWWMVQHARSW